MKHRHWLRTTSCTIISLETTQYLCYNLKFLNSQVVQLLRGYYHSTDDERYCYGKSEKSIPVFHSFEASRVLHNNRRIRPNHRTDCPKNVSS